MNPQVDLLQLTCFKSLVEELIEYDSIGMTDDKLENYLVKLAKLVGVDAFLSHYDTHMSWLIIDVFDYVTKDLDSTLTKKGAIYKIHPICDLDDEKFIMRKWKTIRLLS